MPRNSNAPKDLFGKVMRTRRPRYEAAMERLDNRERAARAARVRWISEVMPKGAVFGLALETYLVFEEARSTYVYGQYVASIVLAASFVEHWFSANLDGRGFHKEASQGLAVSIRCARHNNLVEPILLDKLDRLRLIRNPFVHLKSFDHEHRIFQRSMRPPMHLPSLLENDAKDALIAMYGTAAYAFRATT